MTPFFILPTEQHKLLLGHVATRILEARPDLALNTVVSMNKVYDFSAAQESYFEEPFDYFETAARLVRETEDFDNHLLEVSRDIKEEYKDDENFFFEIFPFKLFNVRGYFSYCDEDNIYVLLFSH